MPPRETSATPKYRQALAALKRRIADGEFPPGTQLPTRVSLQRTFGTSHMTMQRVLNQLAAEGFVEGKRSRGTFVAAHPPHLTRYAVPFYHAPHYEHTESRYENALLTEARRWEADSPLEFVPYYNITGHADAEDYQRLVADLRERRLAGLVMPFAMHRLSDTGVLELPGAYHAHIGQTADSRMQPLVTLAFDSFADRAMQHLAERGRSRVATLQIAHPGPAEQRDTVLANAAQRRGLRCEAPWRQFSHPELPIDTRRCIQLLMQEGNHDRPDALVITDDHLVDETLAALLAAGVRIPDDLEVVAFANFPAGPRPIVPVMRIGFDIGRALREVVGLIERQRAGEAVRRVELQAVDETQYQSQTAPQVEAAS